MMVFIDDFIFNGIFEVDGILFDDSVVVDVIVIVEFAIVIGIDDILDIIIDSNAVDVEYDNYFVDVVVVGNYEYIADFNFKNMSDSVVAFDFYYINFQKT